MQARQIVNHGHVHVNGKKVDIPSFSCSVGDEVTLSPKFVKKSELPQMVKEEVKGIHQPVNWLNEQSNGGVVKSVPTRDDIDKSIKETLIIEFYSR